MEYLMSGGREAKVPTSALRNGSCETVMSRPVTVSQSPWGPHSCQTHKCRNDQAGTVDSNH